MNKVLNSLLLFDNQYRSVEEELARVEIMGNDVENAKGTCAYIQIDPISPNSNPQYLYTKGLFSLTYSNKFCNWTRKKQRYHPDKPFKINTDVTEKNFRLSGWENFEKVCEVLPAYNFLKTKTTLTKKLFDAAKKFPNVTIPFVIDYNKCEIIKVGAFLSDVTKFEMNDYNEEMTVKEIEEYCEKFP